MKVLNLVVALFFAVGLCLAPISDGSVASAASSSTKKTEKSTKKSSKASKKTKSDKKTKASKKDKTEKKGKKQVKKEKKLPAAKSISINKADKKELMMLPGIGPKMAGEIIKYRKANKFKSLEDLKKVKGIGDKTFANLKKYLKL